ncbi:MAG: hypothetical protein DMG14_27825 [Acidobacteria bacterium]|nr:MAG: hypothetical protein DMG14_27825 [Acidobacteriota bacterium]
MAATPSRIQKASGFYLKTLTVKVQIVATGSLNGSPGFSAAKARVLEFGTFRTAERCWEISQGYAFFAYPWY